MIQQLICEVGDKIRKDVSTAVCQSVVNCFAASPTAESTILHEDVGES